MSPLKKLSGALSGVGFSGGRRGGGGGGGEDSCSVMRQSGCTVMRLYRRGGHSGPTEQNMPWGGLVSSWCSGACKMDRAGMVNHAISLTYINTIMEFTDLG